MAKRRMATALVLLLAASVTLAQPARGVDGCATLQKLLRESVYRAATHDKPVLPRGKAALSLQGNSPIYRLACPRTVEVATRAFTRAMSDLGVSIGWYPTHRGDFCWSGDLSQCYPGSRPGEPLPPPDQREFLYDAWKGVQSAVLAHMGRGSSGGWTTFTEKSLEAALWSNLQLAVEGPPCAGYARR